MITAAAEAVRSSIGDWTSIAVGLLTILAAVAGVLWRQAQLDARVSALGDAIDDQGARLDALYQHLLGHPPDPHHRRRKDA